MKLPIPKPKTIKVDPGKAEKLARKQFEQRAETCLKPLQIVTQFEYISQMKPGNRYSVGEQY